MRKWCLSKNSSTSTTTKKASRSPFSPGSSVTTIKATSSPSTIWSRSTQKYSRWEQASSPSGPKYRLPRPTGQRTSPPSRTKPSSISSKITSEASWLVFMTNSNNFLLMKGARQSWKTTFFPSQEYFRGVESVWNTACLLARSPSTAPTLWRPPGQHPSPANPLKK